MKSPPMLRTHAVYAPSLLLDRAGRFVHLKRAAATSPSLTSRMPPPVDCS